MGVVGIALGAFSIFFIKEPQIKPLPKAQSPKAAASDD